MFNEFNLYLSVPQISCFDGDDPAAGDPAAGDPAAGDPAAGDPAAGSGAGAGKTFDQATVNKIVEERLARDRKSREVEHKERYEALRTQHESLLENQNLSEEERSKLETSLGQVRNELRTKEERAKHEQDQLKDSYETQLAKERKDREIWENRFHDSSISRALQDAAVSNDAYNPDHIMQLLRPMTKLTPEVDDAGNETGEFKPVVDFPDHDEKGERVTFSGTPSDIVKRMREIDSHANLFKANVVAGLGAGNATGGVTPGSNGKVDVSKLSPAEYRKIRKENPELLGM